MDAIACGQTLRLVFCGTPEFAVPTLKALVRAGHQFPLVITQPDRPSGRGLQVLPTPVKAVALDAGIEVVQPEKVKNNLELRARLETIAPDAIIVVAYGRIIPKWMLDLPRLGTLNGHASLLPKYRGAAPIQWAVANGEVVTGVTTMRIDEGLDTGEMLLKRELPIAADMTAEDLFPPLAELGAALMAETLDRLAFGDLEPQKQNNAEATLAPILTREDGRVDFHRNALEIYNRWRGFQPWPGAWTLLNGKKLSFSQLRPSLGQGRSAAPGTISTDRHTLRIACGDATSIEVLELQLEGKKRISTADFLRGNALASGELLV